MDGQLIWEPLFDRYLAEVAEANRRDCKLDPALPPGATPRELALLRTGAREQKLVVDPAIERLLARVNGINFDGTSFFGIGISHSSRTDPHARLDLLEMNLLVEERDGDTLYGGDALDFYLHIGATGRFGRRSMAEWYLFHEYATCDEMIAAILAKQLENIERNRRWIAP